MKNKTHYLITSILFFIGGICFLITAVTNKHQDFFAQAPKYVQWLNKYGFYFASICLLIAGVGFLCTYLKNKTK